MDTDAALLKALSQPGPHSGSKLGKTLGISRVAVQKRLAALRDQGLPLEAVAGQGYTLEPGISLLDSSRIHDQLSARAQKSLHELVVVRQVDSTNSWVQRRNLCANQATVCVAESQLAGRGRRGAGWVASPYRNLIFSMGWRFPAWPASLPSLSLIVGLACSQVLEILQVEGVAIKWPNDIYRNNAKLAGTLVQASGEASDYCDVVIGVGLNVSLRDADRSAVDQPCTDLADIASGIDRNTLAALLIEALTEMLPLFAQQGFAPFRSAWESRAIYMGQRVKIRSGDSEEIGIMLGVDEQGALIFRTDAGKEIRYTEADISLRPL